MRHNYRKRTIDVIHHPGAVYLRAATAPRLERKEKSALQSQVRDGAGAAEKRDPIQEIPVGNNWRSLDDLSRQACLV